VSETRRPAAVFSLGLATLSLDTISVDAVEWAEELLMKARTAVGIACPKCHGRGAVPGHRCETCGGSGRSDTNWEPPPADENNQVAHMYGTANKIDVSQLRDNPNHYNKK